MHYNSELPLSLACDASSYGIGAVISHTFPDGAERPIAFASRSLSPTERNYSQLDKEALSLVFGVKRFHQYLYGRKFVLINDYNPLTTILGQKQKVPSIAAARLQRWALLLSAYEYDLKYRRSAQHGNADWLSRLPLDHCVPDEVSSAEARKVNLTQLTALPLTSKELARETMKDLLLCKVFRYTMQGWPPTVGSDLLPFFRKRVKISIEDGCLLWVIRAIIPSSLQDQLLDELHVSHIGMVKRKALARQYMWWSKIDTAIEQQARTCKAFQATGKLLPRVTPRPWNWPSKPFQRIHVDFAGPFLAHIFLLIIDAYSKWLEVYRMFSSTTGRTIDVF